MTSEHSDDIVATNIAWHERERGNSDTVIQFNISDPALNCIVHLMSYQVRFFIF
jgi:hypothetical protein